jgi:uncharacterized protein (TIGR02145 family)
MVRHKILNLASKLSLKPNRKKVLLFPILAGLLIVLIAVVAINHTSQPSQAITITSLSSTTGPATGGQVITITGDFTPTPTMQTFSAEDCSAMEVYANDSDDDRLLTLTDIRNNQQYLVGKLADGNCWMLNSLKIALSDIDSASHNLSGPNVNFVALGDQTMPDNTGAALFDEPRYYDPTCGAANDPTHNGYDCDSSDGDITNDHFYGYLYNWCAVMGATTGACTPSGTYPTDLDGNPVNSASYDPINTASICPANWRLPIGGHIGDPNNEFDQLVAKMAGFTDNQDDTYASTPFNLRFNGPFRGVFAGYWGNTFYDQGVQSNANAHLWSALAYPFDYGSAFQLEFGLYYAGLDYSLSRDYGSSVRCLLQTDADATSPGYTIKFDNTEATVVSSNDTQIVVTTPVHTVGEVDVTISNSIDSPVIMTDAYTYYPTITSVTPNIGPADGGNPNAVDNAIEIKGSGFAAFLPTPTTMQEMSQEYCTNQMQVYNNTGDDSKLLTLTDPRNNQQYLVGKLADGNCWMLNNLRIALSDIKSTESELSNPNVNFVALGDQTTPDNTGYTDPGLPDPPDPPPPDPGDPGIPDIPDPGSDPSDLVVLGAQVMSGGYVGMYYDEPRYYDPTCGQVGSFDTSYCDDSNGDITSENFYGYLYNWCAATGATNSTCTQQDDLPTDATTDICPANWRLPKGGVVGVGDPDNEFDQLNAKTAGFIDNQDSAYLYADIGSGGWPPSYYMYLYFDSPFRGVFAGRWEFGVFKEQNDFGFLWSASVDPVRENVFTLDLSRFLTMEDGRRSTGLAVRCLSLGGTATPAIPTVAIGGNTVDPADIQVIDDKTIRVVPPAHAAGTVDVSITVNGIAAVPSTATADDYNYIGVMSITSITPNSGTTAGGTEVTITGSNIALPTPPTPPTPTTMQQMTQEYCTSMPVYDGTNQAVILTLNDPRGTGQEYQVAKLADGNCWMLNNLKLAGVDLTDEDTDLNINNGSINSTPQGGLVFQLPALDATGNIDGNTPMVYGPLTDDVTADSENYDVSDPASALFGGYLYNWPAATAGETQASMPAGSGNAPNSICPIGWRLPTSDNFANLNIDMYNNGIGTTSSNYYDQSHADNWGLNGPFRGVFAGYWWAGFVGQSIFAGVWSASAYTEYLDETFFLGFDSGNVESGVATSRDYGLAVRCLTPGSAHPTVTLDTGAGTVSATIKSFTNSQIVIQTPAHSSGLVAITISNGVEEVTLPAQWLDTGTSTSTNGSISNISSGFLYQDPYIDLSLDSNNIAIFDGSSIIPTTDGKYGYATNSANVRTNALGYNLSTSTNTSDNNLHHLSLNGNIPAASGLFGSPSSLETNHWGFSIDPTAHNNGDQNKWYQVPDQSSPLTVKSTTTPSETVDSTIFYYGVKIDINQLAGQYRAEIVYTAIANM